MPTPRAFCLALLIAGFTLIGSHAQATETKISGPQLGSVGKGPVIDKSADQTLQKMIAEIAPRFTQHEFSDPKTGKRLTYNLYTPATIKEGEKYPLVLFMADASTPGPDAKSPLIQGYGALIWATPEAQAKNPCYVLVPQFSGVAVNDAWQRTAEVDLVMGLLQNLIDSKNIDSKRLYATGQSMGGMIAIYLNLTHPQTFAASLFVDCHWNPDTFVKLVEQKFIFVTAGDSERVKATNAAIEAACRLQGRAFSYSSWSAKLPQNIQDEQVESLIDKGAPIILINFESGTVLPENGEGSEHMYSFDYAYKLAPAREWLFKQTR